MNAPASPARLAVVLLGSSVLCGGCRSSFEKIREKHRAAIETKLGQLERVGRLLAQTPTLDADSDRLAIPKTAAAVPPQFGVDGMVASVNLMYEETFADLTSYGRTPWRIGGSNLLSVCASLLRKGDCPGGSYSECSCLHSTADSLFERCRQIEYVFVVRFLEYGEPALLPKPDAGRPDAGPDLGPDLKRSPDLGAEAEEASPDSAVRSYEGGAAASRRDAGVRDRGRPDLEADQRVQSWSFRPGLARAEVHLFELASGRRLGGFRLRVESSLRLERSIPAAFTYGESHARGAVEWDFGDALRKKIADELRRRAPGAYWK